MAAEVQTAQREVAKPAPAPAAAPQATASAPVTKVMSPQSLLGNTVLKRQAAAGAGEGPARALLALQGVAGNLAVQRWARSGSAPPSPSRVHRAAQAGVSGPGERLPHYQAIQRSFGAAHDLSGVQAHVGGPAARASAAMRATAFTTGEHVAFKAPPDLWLAAHEAAHVVQQRAGVSLSGGVGREGDPYERHADAVADRVASGRPAHDLFPGSRAAGRSAVQRCGGVIHAGCECAKEAVETAGEASTAVQRNGDGGPATTGGSAAVTGGGAAPPVGKRTGRPIADLEREFRDLIRGARAKKYNVAADNLEHFLDGHGATFSVPLAWLRGFSEVTDAENKNHGRFEDQLKQQAKKLADGASATFSDHWDAALTASPFEELYYASGTSELSSVGSFTLTRAGNIVTITGTVNQRWHDPYNWNPGMSAFIPGYGKVSDDVGLDLKDAGRGQDYLLEDLYRQALTGTYTIRPWYLPDTSSFTWSGP